MPTAFLLRFQDLCSSSESQGTPCILVSEVSEGNEQQDHDLYVSDSILAHPSLSDGTMTKTGIEREAGGQDQDRTESQMRVFARSGTKTKIKGEHSGDFTLGETTALSFFRSHPQAVAQTKTITAVKAEADDNDPKRGVLQAIPTCS